MINEVKTELVQLCNEIIVVLQRLRALEIITEDEFENHTKLKKSFLKDF